MIIDQNEYQKELKVLKICLLFLLVRPWLFPYSTRKYSTTRPYCRHQSSTGGRLAKEARNEDLPKSHTALEAAQIETPHLQPGRFSANHGVHHLDNYGTSTQTSPVNSEAPSEVAQCNRAARSASLSEASSLGISSHRFRCEARICGQASDLEPELFPC